MNDNIIHVKVCLEKYYFMNILKVSNINVTYPKSTTIMFVFD